MPIGLFEKRFGRRPEEFPSLIDLTKFIEGKLRRRLRVGEDFLDLIPLRGKVLPVVHWRGTRLVEKIFSLH